MTTKNRKRAAKPIYFVVRRMVDIATGEEIGALVPNSWFDRRLMRERGYAVNSLLRADLKKPRNVRFHRLVHGLGTLVVQNIDEFRALDSHAAIKRLQLESGVMCEPEELELPGVGRLIRKIPRSISFDEMEEGEFKQLWEGICNHICSTYWPDLDLAQIEGMIDLMPQQAGAA